MTPSTRVPPWSTITHSRASATELNSFRVEQRPNGKYVGIHGRFAVHHTIRIHVTFWTVELFTKFWWVIAFYASKTFGLFPVDAQQMMISRMHWCISICRLYVKLCQQCTLPSLNDIGHHIIHWCIRKRAQWGTDKVIGACSLRRRWVHNQSPLSGCLQFGDMNVNCS